MFAPPPVIETEIFASLPAAMRIMEETPWTRRRGSGPLHSFLEGPSFDRAGNLYCVDICHGRIFRIPPSGEWQVFARYDGCPNGLKIHRDGRIFVTDQEHGVLVFDPATGARIDRIAGPAGGAFAAVNDLHFADDGTLYITDPGQSSLDNPVGRVYRWREGGPVELVAENLPYPNGLVLDGSQHGLLVALTRSLQILRLPVKADRARAEKIGLFIQLSGGLAGPDGLALDDAGSLAVAHSGLATVWLFDRLGEPIARIKSCAGIRPTNVAYGGADRRDLYITESEQGVILRARLSTPGRVLFSHR
ncbi:MAG: SMP-30/gluconolactonase/LRE family protein [Alphaproteobacteria bacterium]|nr:SMP-30/gluconolactonase/LRE family protein [Alphaproteobacteria bacterium]